MRILINGARGKLGSSIIKNLLENGYKDLVCVDVIEGSFEGYTIYNSLNNIDKNVDAVIDCSAASAIDSIIDFSIKSNTILIICTTGYSDLQLSKIKRAGTNIPVLLSPNMSYGANVLFDIVERISKKIPDWDVEIVETHHAKKIDKPSGTAKKLKEIISNFNNKKINVHSLRLANIIGIHKIIFASNNESITIEHKANDRSVFASGILKALNFLKNKKKGFYTFKDIL